MKILQSCRRRIKSSALGDCTLRFMASFGPLIFLSSSPHIWVWVEQPGVSITSWVLHLGPSQRGSPSLLAPAILSGVSVGGMGLGVASGLQVLFQCFPFLA